MAHRLPDADQVRSWSGQDVINWLHKVELSECVPMFETRQIDGAALLELTEEQLVFMCTDLKLKHRVIEMLAFSSAPMATLGRQLTKYINQCKEKDLTLKSAKKKILSIAQPRKTVQTPPPVPDVDYNSSGQQTTGDDSEHSWDTDFDESDCEDIEEYVNGDVTNAIEDKSPSDVEPELNFPAQPVIPQRKAKKMENGGEENVDRTNASPWKPPIANKPQLKSQTASPNKTVSETPSLNKTLSETSPTGVPRPPSGLPTKPFGTRGHVARPTTQPPPPPCSPGTIQLPELNEHLKKFVAEEYEIPVNCPSPSSASEGGSVVRSPSSVTSESDSASSASSSTYSDQPTLPPRSSNNNNNAPPLPRRPGLNKFGEIQKETTKSSKSPPMEKPVLLPTRRSGEISKNKDVRQLKGLSEVLKTKLTTLLHPSEKSPKTDLSSSQSGSMTSTPEHSVTASMINLCQDQTQPATLPRTRSQDAIGSLKDNVTHGRGHRASLDDTGAVQNRPLPPVPGGQTNVQQNHLHNCIWFHGIERYAAEEILSEMKETGSYLVRQSRRAGEENPYTLNILFENKVFHLNIRHRNDGMFALGKEKENEKTFSTVEDLVNYYQNEPILLTTKGMVAGKTCLLFTPAKR